MFFLGGGLVPTMAVWSRQIKFHQKRPSPLWVHGSIQPGQGECEFVPHSQDKLECRNSWNSRMRVVGEFAVFCLRLTQANKEKLYTVEDGGHSLPEPLRSHFVAAIQLLGRHWSDEGGRR